MRLYKAALLIIFQSSFLMAEDSLELKEEITITKYWIAFLGFKILRVKISQVTCTMKNLKKNMDFF